MARVTVRIPDKLKRQMDEQEETNWSGFIRNRLKEEIDYPNPPRKIRQLIREQYLEGGGDIERAWALHLTTRTSDRHARETAQQLFGDDATTLLQSVRDDLKEAGLEDLQADAGRDLTVGQAIREELEDSGLLADIQEACRNRIQNAPEEKRVLVWLLAHHVGQDFDRDYASIKPDGLRKAYSLLMRDEYDKEDISAILAELGLIYYYRHNTNQYFYWSHRIPEYAIPILEEIVNSNQNINLTPVGYSLPDKDHMTQLLQDDIFLNFLDWLGGSRRRIEVSEEEEVNQEYPGGTEAFEEVAAKLIREGVLQIDYLPHRSSKGGNSGARGARWIYEISPAAYDAIGQALIEEQLLNTQPHTEE